MIKHQIAVNFAKALFNLGGSSQEVQKREEELQLLAKLAKEVPGMISYLGSPQLDLTQKIASLEKSVGHPLDPHVVKMLGVLAKKHTLSALRQIATEYHKLVVNQLKEVEVDIASAEPLTEEEINLIVKKLEQTLKRKPSITKNLDKNLLGGFTLLAHDKFLDLSLRGKLTKLKSQLTKVKV